jgi:flagellar biosynthetic protein FlhB
MPKDPSKTEQATPKRRKKAREEGNVAKGMELPKATVLLAGLAGLYLFIGLIDKEIRKVFSLFLGSSPQIELGTEGVYSLLLDMSGSIALMVLPPMAVMAAVAFLTQRLQVGPLWTTKVFEPKFGKMFNVPAGLQRMFFSTKTLVNLVKNVLMALVIAIAPVIVLNQEIKKASGLFYANAGGVAAYILDAGARMVLYALVPMLLIAIADLFYTRWDYEENIKMSKDEVKDEHKQQEGDPEVKRKQREKMMQSMAKRMLQNVPKADVVVTNPTHIAVALQYDPLQAPAPLVLAKGADHLAEKIKEVARENRVPIRENVTLARALYKSCEVGDSIPEELFQAVAQILAQVYKIKRGRN